jgi:hypothetical protein
LTPGIACGFAGVSCPAENQCVAVGGTTDISGPLVDSITSSGWTRLTPAVPSGSTSSTFKGASCPSESFCVAVGSYDDSSDESQVLAEEWNGSSWREISLQTPSGATSTDLNGVSCDTDISCMAVDSYSRSTGGTVALAYELSGAMWQIESPATPEGATSSNLTGVSCMSADGCVVVGSDGSISVASTALADSWNGSSWTQESVSIPSSTGTVFNGVSC